MRGLHTSEKKMKEKNKTKAVEKKSIPTYYLSFNSGEKKINKKQTNNYFLPQFLPARHHSSQNSSYR